MILPPLFLAAEGPRFSEKVDGCLKLERPPVKIDVLLRCLAWSSSITYSVKVPDDMRGGHRYRCVIFASGSPWKTLAAALAADARHFFVAFVVVGEE